MSENPQKNNLEETFDVKIIRDWKGRTKEIYYTQPTKTRRKVEITSDEETQKCWDDIIDGGKSVKCDNQELNLSEEERLKWNIPAGSKGDENSKLTLNFPRLKQRPLIPEVKKVLHKRYWMWKLGVWKRQLSFLNLVRSIIKFLCVKKMEKSDDERHNL